MRPEMAPQLLADRCTDRLEETGGEALVDRPFPWLMRRGLVQRQGCSDRRCDDGTRLDTGGECENCGNVVHIRRARRAKIAAEVDRELPGLTEGERRRVLEKRLREQAAIEAEDFVRRGERARAELRPARLPRSGRSASAMPRLPQTRCARPCRARTAGRNGRPACARRAVSGAGPRRRSWRLAWSPRHGRPPWTTRTSRCGHCPCPGIAGIRHRACRREFLALLEPGELDADPILAASALAFAELQAVQRALPEYRSSALGWLGRTPEAEAEARRAYAT